MRLHLDSSVFECVTTSALNSHLRRKQVIQSLRGSMMGLSSMRRKSDSAKALESLDYEEEMEDGR